MRKFLKAVFTSMIAARRMEAEYYILNNKSDARLAAEGLKRTDLVQVAYDRAYAS